MERKRNGNKLILLLVLFVLVFSGAVWWMTDQQLATNQGQKTIKTYTLKQEVILGRFVLELNEVQRKPKIVGETNAVDATGTFYLVNVSLRNLDANPQTPVLSQFKMLLSNGSLLAADNTASLLANPTGHAFFLKNVTANETVKGTLVFDVPKGETPQLQATSGDQTINFDLKQ
ncbi:DUF4352 domain-containing protein [Tumebacillus permanentifrigoris]|uniref:Uncharacterized protein DUF4352 n=1 Tax=Tumebacillus permanentifrigoris TaxID=378543 RepID=A0A316D7R5_9BACL|nr:DUF4352 domain-containing protein [Tumebacillus permanentifrigoris]PWK11349.1 uncharacterized protein DUF4352 [Tumebacillus permanentifrigoris]